MRPVDLGTRYHGNHVHVAHEHNGFEDRIGTAQCHQQRVVDKLDLARRKHVRPGLLHIGAQVVERLPVHRLGIHARDGRKRQHATQALARASFVQIGKIILMRKEAPNLGHDILSIVMTKAAPTGAALQRKRLRSVICPRDSERGTRECAGVWGCRRARPVPHPRAPRPCP